MDNKSLGVIVTELVGSAGGLLLASIVRAFGFVFGALVAVKLLAPSWLG